jgi:hypothetical protein
MSSHRDATDNKGADGVAAEALRGPSVEELGVLVAFDDGPKFPPLLRVGSASQDKLLQGGPAGDTKRALLQRESTILLKQIEKINDEFAIIFKQGIEFVVALPNLGRIAEGFQTSCQVTSSISDGSGSVPGGEGGGEEKGISKPAIFEPKTRRARDQGRGGDEQGNVV